uniref:1,2-dichloropropane reductive dehalogenase anchoring protein n=1 Tax=Dehalococcoides mccartyi TaxID=61435 RepID=V5JY76_9CHLR|nr:1,2-dichloropropane reductive dehalogenase anchoring protein [Dehalococcoides mccartyi]
MNFNIDFKWYEWLFGVISLILASFLTHEVFATLAESQPGTVKVLSLLIGIPLIIFLYLTFGLRSALKKHKSN